ncbi:hypothetical protein L6452_18468 [Arctium lappa]|uniref:Uncharacterized protein n=1 Tax=Arctium lappa TaxID=4217 RepID=A0ACB9C699_ARCLA|nr:hypothetical protein L6452_18468 [Arctium lappa]
MGDFCDSDSLGTLDLINNPSGSRCAAENRLPDEEEIVSSSDGKLTAKTGEGIRNSDRGSKHKIWIETDCFDCLIS